MNFTCNLADLLREKSLTQTQLHDGCGVSKTTINKLTRGGRIDRIDRDTTHKIVSFLGCEFQELWTIAQE